MIESELSNIGEIVTSGKATFFALEGMGGSGKSHIIRMLMSDMLTQGFRVMDYKVSGMGSGKRIGLLRRIKEERSKIIESGKATPKIIEDSQKDRIFLLAMKYQIRNIARETKSSDALDFVFLDRTPLMPWVYSISTNERNPFLGEILNKGIDFSKQLNIDTQYVFDISPETSYARMIARMCTNTPDPDKVIRGVLEQIDAPTDTASTIREKTIKLLKENRGIIIPKAGEGYPFIPFKTMSNERKFFLQAADILKAKCNIRFVVINAESEPEEIKNEILRDIKIRTGKGRENG